MLRQILIRSLGLGLVALVLTHARPAAAGTESCTRAHAAGQREQNAGHLKQALASFQMCASDAECPLPIRNECTQLYTTVEARLPTLVFSVVDASGNDVVDVQISSGDTALASGLDGRPIAVNPGLHTLRFELASGEVLTKSVVVRQGEKDRIISLKLPRGDLGSASPPLADDSPVERFSPKAESAPEPAPAAAETRLRVPLASWIAYGVGIAALGSWGTFALLGRNEESKLDKCAPECASTLQGDYDAMKRNYLIADVSLGVAGAAAVAGTVMLFTLGRRPQAGVERAQASKREKAMALSPGSLGRSGWGLTLAGRY